MPTRALELMTAKLLQIAFRSDFEYSELQSGILCSVWGLWMLPAVHHGPLVVMLSHAIYPSVLGCFFLSCGIIQIWSLLRRLRNVRRFAALATLTIWAFVACLTWQINKTSIVLPTSACFTFGAFWALLRMHGEPISSDDQS